MKKAFKGNTLTVGTKLPKSESLTLHYNQSTINPIGCQSYTMN